MRLAQVQAMSSLSSSGRNMAVVKQQSWPYQQAAGVVSPSPSLSRSC